MGEHLFRSFQRDSRPLSDHLTNTYARKVLDDIQQMSIEELTVADARTVADELVRKIRVDPPVLGGTEAGRVGEHEGGWREVIGHAGMRRGTTRFWVAIELTGDFECLAWWPDRAPSVPALVPVDHLPVPAATDEVRSHLSRHRDEQWFVNSRDEHGPVALYTFVDLTHDEVLRVKESGFSPRSVVDSERAYIEPIVRAIADQVRDFFDNDLLEIAQTQIENRTTRLRALAAVAEDLKWPVGFKFPEPRVESSVAPTAMSAEAVPEGLALPPRLSSATFDDMMRTVRKWGNAVERYPDSYTILEEERLSDQLAATLNAALPGAEREVYTRAGKSDLFVRADAIDTGAAPARIFIGECKWWSGPSDAADAYSQLVSYLEVKDSYCMLLFFSRNRDGAKVRAGAIAKLKELGGEDGPTSPVEGWPYLSFQHDSTNFTLCVAVLDLPPTKPSAAATT